ncbi:C4-dicarboxylate ABC transporter [Paracoccus suum]|uniref:TRAP transporter small permease protein n=1 Tax=Paracoccus suum TaxID=2259340 RepID=A0A344PM30_9RHOB|nr:C4-dicarboxylate ABC transporter [Paracoccus suum]
MGGLLGLARGIDRINTLIGRTVGWAILVAVLVSAANAVVRKVFNISSNAWLELQWYLYGAAFLGAAAYTLLENEHIRIDIVYGRWRRRTQHWIDLIGHVLFLMPFTMMMIWLLYPWALRSFRNGEVSNNAGGLPLWPAKMMLLAAFIMLFAQGLSEIIKKIAVMRGIIPDPTPFVSHHEAAELEGQAIAQEMAQLVDPDHPALDLAIDSPLDHNDPRPGHGSTRLPDEAPGSNEGRGPRT